VAAGNTLAPAWLALQQKGYVVRSEHTGTEAERWVAASAERDFIAPDPLSLLGLVALYETRGDEWQATDAEIEAFLARYST
jgi:hypothetical protein